MFVKIGSYPSRISSRIYENYMNKKHGYVDWPTYANNKPFDEYWRKKVEDGLQYLYDYTINQILDHRNQKIKVRIDRWDTWSMDHTLAHIVVPMLKQLKETKHGAPFVDLQDVPKELYGKKLTKKQKEQGDLDDKHFERWDYILDEMIFAFESKLDDSWEDEYYKYEDGHPNEPFGLKLVWKDDEGRKAHQARISNGFRLFGKYFENLWD